MLLRPMSGGASRRREQTACQMPRAIKLPYFIGVASSEIVNIASSTVERRGVGDELLDGQVEDEMRRSD